MTSTTVSSALIGVYSENDHRLAMRPKPARIYLMKELSIIKPFNFAIKTPQGRDGLSFFNLLEKKEFFS